MEDLRAAIDRLAASGQLHRLAADLAPAATDPAAAAEVAAADAAGGGQPRARARGARQQARPGGRPAPAVQQGQRLQQQHAVQEQPSWPQRQQQRGASGSQHGGQVAVGRRLRVWLDLDGEQQRHEGRVAEVTPPVGENQDLRPCWLSALP